MSTTDSGRSRQLAEILMLPMRAFMALTGHRTDRSMTPVQPSEFAERVRATNYLEQLAREQAAHHVVKSAEHYLRELDDQIAGRPRIASTSRN